MSLNEILSNEQLTLMQHAVADNPIEISKYRRKLSIFASILKGYTYPHRSYLGSNDDEGLSVPRLPGSKPLLPSVAAWENEGGFVKKLGSQKSQNRDDDKSKAATPQN